MKFDVVSAVATRVDLGVEPLLMRHQLNHQINHLDMII